MKRSNRTVEQFQHDTHIAYDHAARAAAARRGDLGLGALIEVTRFDIELACKEGRAADAAALQKERKALMLELIEMGLVDDEPLTKAA